MYSNTVIEIMYTTSTLYTWLLFTGKASFLIIFSMHSLIMHSIQNGFPRRLESGARLSCPRWNKIKGDVEKEKAYCRESWLCRSADASRFCCALILAFQEKQSESHFIPKPFGGAIISIWDGRWNCTAGIHSYLVFDQTEWKCTMLSLKSLHPYKNMFL